MSPPGEAAVRFAWALALGLDLGVLLDLLVPLRPGHKGLTDLALAAAVFWAWLELSFRVCRGDIRLVYHLGMALGALAWLATGSRWLRPRVTRIWKWLGRCRTSIRKILKKPEKIKKNTLQPGENRVQ